MNSKITVCLGCIAIGLLMTGCMHYKEESGRKTEYNDATGRFETSDYASAGFSTSKPKSQPVSEKDLKKAEPE